MKQLIMDVLEDMSGGQINLASEAARKTVANTIVAAMKTNKKGWYLDIGAIDGKPKLTKEELETQRAKESWMCAICGKSTYDVEYDYIGSGTNHLGCELKLELEEPVQTEDGEYVEEGIRREKNWLQKKHEGKVFGDDLTIGIANEDKVFGEDEIKRGSDRRGGDRREENWNIPPGEEVDGMYFDDEVKEWEEAVGYKEEVKKTDTLINKSVEDFERNKLSEEIVDDKDAGYIYESPDGGKTVYRRESGSDKKTKIKIEVQD